MSQTTAILGTPSSSSGPGKVDLVKMNGLGNEIVVADLRASARLLSSEEVRRIAAVPRWRFDQMMVLHPPRTPGTVAFVRIYNSDGTAAGACGNGMRCVGWYVTGGERRADMRFETEAGLLRVDIASEEQITVDMGRPRLRWDEIPLSEPFHDTRRIELQIGPIDAPVLHSPSAVNMGNPHVVFWVDDVEAHDLARHGSLLENHPLFPDRANISLAQVMSRTSIRVRTWERGAGLTRACGSAACAAVVAAARLGYADRQVTVILPGGALRIEWRSDDHVYMTGPAVLEHVGSFVLGGSANAAMAD